MLMGSVTGMRLILLTSNSRFLVITDPAIGFMSFCLGGFMNLYNLEIDVDTF